MAKEKDGMPLTQPRLNNVFFNGEGQSTNSKPMSYWISDEDYAKSREQTTAREPRWMPGLRRREFAFSRYDEE